MKASKSCRCSIKKKELYRKGVMGGGVKKLTVWWGVKKFSVGDEGVKKFRRGLGVTQLVWGGLKRK